MSMPPATTVNWRGVLKIAEPEISQRPHDPRIDDSEARSVAGSARTKADRGRTGSGQRMAHLKPSIGLRRRRRSQQFPQSCPVVGRTRLEYPNAHPVPFRAASEIRGAERLLRINLKHTIGKIEASMTGHLGGMQLRSTSTPNPCPLPLLFQRASVQSSV